MTTSSSLGKFIVGALIGGAIGAAFGMLLAPRSGVETREMIREEWDNRTRSAADNVREKTEMVKEKAREKAVAIKEKLTDIGSEFEEAGRRTVNKLKERTSVEPSA